MQRLRNLDAPFDLLVVGGGIIGAGIARDAARRGLRVALFEKTDFGGGTTAGSTRLIHGGLRYLEMLDFRLVRMDLRERETLLRVAPHRVRPLEFLLPFYDRELFERAKLRAGMLLYDALSFDKDLPNHRSLDAAETRSAEPHLSPQGLQAAVAYYDAQVDSPERLCLENLIDAREQGAVVLNYAEVTGALHQGAAVTGLRVRDVLEGGEVEVSGRLVVNASGPWFDRVAGRLGPHPRPRIRTTKGIHLAVAPVSQRAVALFSELDGRLVFVIPWLGYSWVGTTDTDFGGDPAEACATAEDVDYLLRSLRRYFPPIASGPVHWSNAGVRALVAQEGRESSVSRAHRVEEGPPGLISVLGGKLTGYRVIAQEVTDLAGRRLRLKAPCTTAQAPLPGAAGRAPGEAPSGVEAETLEHLRSLYGSLAAPVLAIAASHQEWAARLAPQYPDIAAQVAFAVRQEACERLTDFLLRRSLLGFSPDQGMAAAPAVARLMAEELNWTAARQAAELEAYQNWVEQTQAFRGELRGSNLSYAS